MTFFGGKRTIFFDFLVASASPIFFFVLKIGRDYLPKHFWFTIFIYLTPLAQPEPHHPTGPYVTLENFHNPANKTLFAGLIWQIREGLKKIVEFSTKRLPPPSGRKIKKNEKWSTHHEMNSLWYGSSDTCQMASLQSFKGLTHPSDQDPSWEGSPHPKIENNKCVINCHPG